MGCLLLTAFSVSARQIENWTYDRLFREASLVLIASAKQTKDTADQIEAGHDKGFIGQETAFEVHRILKGDLKSDHELRVLHYRLPQDILTANGPLFVSFRHEESRLEGVLNGVSFAASIPAPDYLLFLRLRADGRFEPVSGPIDSALSVREINAGDGFFSEISTKQAYKDGTGQSATRPADEPEGGDQSKPESEGRSR